MKPVLPSSVPSVAGRTDAASPPSHAILTQDKILRRPPGAPLKSTPRFPSKRERSATDLDGDRRSPECKQQFRLDRYCYYFPSVESGEAGSLYSPVTTTTSITTTADQQNDGSQSRQAAIPFPNDRLWMEGEEELEQSSDVMLPTRRSVLPVPNLMPRRRRRLFFDDDEEDDQDEIDQNCVGASDLIFIHCSDESQHEVTSLPRLSRSNQDRTGQPVAPVQHRLELDGSAHHQQQEQRQIPSRNEFRSLQWEIPDDQVENEPPSWSHTNGL